MTRTFLILAVCAVFLAAIPVHAQDAGVTVVIDIDNRPVSIEVADVNACQAVIENRIKDLKTLSQNNFTVASVVGECFDRSGQLLLSGRCGVKIGSGQITYLCVPKMQAPSN